MIGPWFYASTFILSLLFVLLLIAASIFLMAGNTFWGLLLAFAFASSGQ